MTIPAPSTFNNKGIERIEHNGPNGIGLSEWETMDPKKLASGNPVQHGYMYDELEDQGYSAGVWDCTAFDDLPGAYPVDEYMFLLEGQIIMVMPDGTQTIIKQGEAFIIPKGLECQWKMPGYVRKIFMILDLNNEPTTANRSLDCITKPDLESIKSADQQALIHSNVLFANADARMLVKRQDFQADISIASHAGTRQVVTVLKGVINIEQDTYSAGDSFYVHETSNCKWDIKAGTQLIQASFVA